MHTAPSFEFCEGASPYPLIRQDLERKGDRQWGVNNSPLTEYGHERMAPDDTSLLPPFLVHLEQHAPGAAIDIAGGSNGRALQDLLSVGLVRRAVVTNYEDLRSVRTRFVRRLNHINGDLTDEATWLKIERWKNKNAPDGFSAVLHRPVAALQYHPKSFYMGAVHRLIDWTAPNGVLLLQVPAQVANLRAGVSVARRPDVAEVRTNQWRSHALITKN